MTKKEILEIKVNNHSLGEVTIREYLKTLLKMVWEEEESFSGKRPFGESGWQHDLYTPLALKGLIPATVEDGYAEDIDFAAGDELILELIEEAFKE